MRSLGFVVREQHLFVGFNTQRVPAAPPQLGRGRRKVTIRKACRVCSTAKGCPQRRLCLPGSDLAMTKGKDTALAPCLPFSHEEGKARKISEAHSPRNQAHLKNAM